MTSEQTVRSETPICSLHYLVPSVNQARTLDAFINAIWQFRIVPDSPRQHRAPGDHHHWDKRTHRHRSSQAAACANTIDGRAVGKRRDPSEVGRYGGGADGGAVKTKAPGMTQPRRPDGKGREMNPKPFSYPQPSPLFRFVQSSVHPYKSPSAGQC